MLFKSFISHEVLNLLKSRRIYLTILLFLLLFISIFTARVIDYQKQINQYISDLQDMEVIEKPPMNYSYIKTKAIEQPKIFSIYNQGYQYPRITDIVFYEPIYDSYSMNEESNLHYTQKNRIDITFLITFFLSLFVLLISYDSINGEKQTGTLRLLLTFPIKRQSVILKKILGIFIFVAYTFTIPYTLSLIYLMIIYANLLTTSFFLSAAFYWFLALLFIFFFSLLGIFISVCSCHPNRSLVYALLTWIMLSIVLPISWEYIGASALYEKELFTLEQIQKDKLNYAHKVFHELVPEDDKIKYDLILSGGGFYENFVRSFIEGNESYYRFQRYVYNSYFPASREVEMAKDEIIRKEIDIEQVKSRIFFYNPIVLFADISNKIAGNSLDDYLMFLVSARRIRDEIINMGAREGWLFDYRFFAMYEDPNLWGHAEDWNKRLEEVGFAAAIQEIISANWNAEKFSFVMPVIPSYEQPNPTFGEIFSRIAGVMSLLVVSIIGLWVLTWWRFMRYDVR